MPNDYPTLRDAVAAGARRLRLYHSALTTEDRNTAFFALRDVNFHISRGEVVGLIGSNGAGKSTLLKILAQIIDPTTGWAEIHGRLCALLEVGTGFHPELTGRENILLNGSILGMHRTDIKARFDEIVDFAGVEAFIDIPIKRYSSGMYLRLAFAVAAHVDPDILIIDEVLAVGDAAFQLKCIEKVNQMACNGRTVLFVSHHLGIVQKLCSRAMLIRDGTIAEDGPTARVIAEYVRSVERLSGEDLATRADRRGRGRLRLAKIEIRSDGANSPVSGGCTKFCFQVAGDRLPFHCSFTIYNHHGEAVTSFDSAERSVSGFLCESFVCELRPLLFRPGRYRVNAALTSCDGILEDHIEGAALFDVIPGVFGETIVHPTPGYGSVIVPHRWSSLG
jgi:lipopolysaccharide transport system ATP-binding protein